MEQTTARVSAVHKERYELLLGGGRVYGKLKTGVYLNGDEPYPTTGDYVTVLRNPGGDSVIISTHPRKTFFARQDPDKTRPREQAVAANFDTVFIMQSLNQDFNPRRVERYLTPAWQSGAEPVILLTKADLTDDPSPRLRALEPVAMGVSIIPLSAKTGAGMEALDAYLRPGKTAVFLGSSGVGKSSLLNALMGETVMEVNDIREDDAKGRHTTTRRQLVILPNGACVIDTPGMRELGVWEASEGLNAAFSDVEALLGVCRFSDCRHGGEPGCAIRAAVERGDITAQRWESYLKLKRETLYAEDKAAAIRAKSERIRGIVKREKNRKKGIWQPKKR